MRNRVLLSAILFISFTSVVSGEPADSPIRVSIIGKITEMADGHPIAYAQIVVMKNGTIITGTIADELGNYEIKNLYPGTYTVQAYLIGFHRSQIDTTLAAGYCKLNFALVASDITLQGVTITANSESNPKTIQKLDIVANAPEFQTSTYHGAPTSLPSTIIQQSLPGAVQAPTGEVHIRGQHAEYSYNVDGLPVPETQSEGMTELFDPRVVDHISFLVGDLPAEYSDALAIIDVRTKIPATPFNASASGYDGSFNSSGQSISVQRPHRKFRLLFRRVKKSNRQKNRYTSPRNFPRPW